MSPANRAYRVGSFNRRQAVRIRAKRIRVMVSIWGDLPLHHDICGPVCSGEYRPCFL